MLIQYQNLKIGAERLALIETANGIIGEYEADGLTLTLRQLYYQFVARGIIPNSDRSYKNLGALVSDGRMAGLISWESIEDRGRGVRPWLINEDEADVLDGIEYQFALDLWERQNVYVEVWVEKEALAGVLERPARRMRAPYMPCKGYLSASEAWRAGRRFMEKGEEGRRLVMIHLGDHDPSGIDMTRDNADRLELFGEECGVEVRRIALNRDQIDRYNPPENPAKMSDSRAEDYVRVHGYSSWELDALEPRVLEALVTNELESLVDRDLWDATLKEERERRALLSSLHERFDEVKEFLARDPDEY